MRDEIVVPHGPLCVGSYSLILYSLFLLENLIGPQLFKESVLFMEVRCSSPCSQGPTISDHPDALESSPQIPILFKGYFRIALPSVPRFFKYSLFFSLLRATCPTYLILLDLFTLVAFCRSKIQRNLCYESLPNVLLLSLSYIQIYCSHYCLQ
jgi:hypothetical protein